MPPSRGGDCGNRQPPRGTARARERGNRGARKKKFPEENQACLSEAAAAAVAASSSDQEERSVPNWRPEEEFDPQVTLEVINSRNALSGGGSDGLRFSYLQSTIWTGFGREKIGAGIEFEAFWRRIIDDPNAFPPEFWQLFLEYNLTALGEKCHPVCVRMAWRRLIAAGTMRQWRPRLEEANREARQFGVGVRGGVEQIALRARVPHEANNWLILTGFSNAFNTVKQTAMLAEAATCAQALTPFVAKCYGGMSALVFFQMEPEKGGRSTAPAGCNKGVPWGRRCSACRSCRC